MSIRFKNENDGDWTRMSHLVQRIGGDLEKTTRQHTAHGLVRVRLVRTGGLFRIGTVMGECR